MKLRLHGTLEECKEAARRPGQHRPGRFAVDAERFVNGRVPEMPARDDPCVTRLAPNETSQQPK
jgi:hypothetical protein